MNIVLIKKITKFVLIKFHWRLSTLYRACDNQRTSIMCSWTRVKRCLNWSKVNYCGIVVREGGGTTGKGERERERERERENESELNN